jgi:hypothetical protein
VHNLWHFQHRLIRKVLAHTVGVFLNLQLGRRCISLSGQMIDVLPQFIEALAHDRGTNGQQSL